MSQQQGAPLPSGVPEGTAVLIRLNPRFGGGRAVLCHLDPEGCETEIEQFQSEGYPTPELPDISDRIRAEIEAGREAVILDLVHVPWLNSRGLGYLVGLWTTITRAGGRPVLVNVSPRLMDLFKLMKLDEIFRFADAPAAR